MPLGATPPTLADKVVGGSLFAAQNVGVAALPLLQQVAPGVNPSGAGGPEVNLLAMGLGAVVQPMKMFTWFDQNRWAPWVLLVGGVAVALLLWHDQVAKALLNGLASAYTAQTNYGQLKPLGVLPPGTPTARDAG